MSTYEIIKKRFIDPFNGKTIGNIGVELEFPLINVKGESVSREVTDGLMEMFLRSGFRVEEFAGDGTPLFISNPDGDCLSFDNSYNNFEFAMNYGDNLYAIAQRFFKYFNTAQEYLKGFSYMLAGTGINPHIGHITQNRVDYPVYNMVNEFLHSFPAEHSFPDFPAYLSSIQTHLDVSVAELPRAATLFARLDFVRAALFANSPKDGYLCFRDMLWEGSAFPNTGKVDEIYETTDDIINSFMRRRMFNRIRGGKYEIFKPVTVDEYFKLPDALPDDILGGLTEMPAGSFRTYGEKWLAFAGITASHLSGWYERHRLCGKCGEATRLSEIERMIECPSCKEMYYPRISPAVIVGVTNGSRLLLTRYANRPVTNYALIAGFCEIGESIENTVRREVFEEVGVRVKNIRFYKSQPWGFSSSLLMGFYCDLDGSEEITLDRNELAVAEWIDREKIAVTDTSISLTSEMIESFRRNIIK